MAQGFGHRRDAQTIQQKTKDVSQILVGLLCDPLRYLG